MKKQSRGFHPSLSSQFKVWQACILHLQVFGVLCAPPVGLETATVSPEQEPHPPQGPLWLVSLSCRAPCASEPGQAPRHCRQMGWVGTCRAVQHGIFGECHAKWLTLVTHQDLPHSPQPHRIRLRIPGMVNAVAAQHRAPDPNPWTHLLATQQSQQPMPLSFRHPLAPGNVPAK